MTNRHKGEVEAPEFGDGCILRYDWNALAELEAKHGDAWWSTVVNGLERLSVPMVLEVTRVGLQKNGDKVVEPPTPDVPVRVIAEKLLDALCIGQRGKTYAELAEEADVKFQKNEDAEIRRQAKMITALEVERNKANPPKSPEAKS